MTELILVIQSIIVLFAFFKLYKHFDKKSKAKGEATRVYEYRKKHKEVEVADLTTVKLTAALYQNRGIGNKLIEIYGVYSEKLLKIRGGAGSRSFVDRYIGDFLVKVPEHIVFDLDKVYKVKGIYDGKVIYLTEIDDKSLLEVLKGASPLSIKREMTKEEKLLFIKDKRKNILIPIMLIATMIPYWKSNANGYNWFLVVCLLITYLPLIMEKKEIHSLEGEYSGDLKGNNIIGKIRVRGRKNQDLDEVYRVGERVRVEGFRDFKSKCLILTSFRGFDFERELLKLRVKRVGMNMLILIIFSIVSIFIYKEASIKEYIEYFKVKDLKVDYTDRRKIREEVILNQYIEISDVYSFPIRNEDGRIDNYLVDKSWNGKILSKYGAEIEELRSIEKSLEELKKGIDFTSTERNYTGITSYKQLREKYNNGSIDEGSLEVLYKEMIRENRKKLIEDIKGLREQIERDIESDIIVNSKSIRLYIDNVYEDLFAKEIYNYSKLKGIVKGVEETDGLKKITLESSNYNEVAWKGGYIITLGIFAVYILALIISSFFELKRIIELKGLVRK